MLGVGQVLTWTGTSIPGAILAFVLAVIASGFELLPKAVRSLRGRRLDIHVLMTLAIGGALAIGAWDEAATVAFLFGLSEALEALSLERARRAVRSLLDIAPQSAERIEPDGSTREVPASELRRGDRVRVRAGNRIPIDGVVRSGCSSVDQQAITGESVPVLRESGDEVFAGTVNGDGALEIAASKPLDDAVVTRIVERVRQAQAGRTPVERTIERFASLYTPSAVLLAILVMLVPPLLGFGPTWRHWFGQGLVVLVISCPCALVIGTPVAVVSALASAARRGILIKSGQFLEGVGQLKTLAFDKTGTLTLGRPDVVEVVSLNGRERDDLLRIAAALGDQGGHVLGQAIARHARALEIDVPPADSYQARPGLGASGRVDSVEYHMGSHRYLDESGLCPPEFHLRLNQAEGQDVGTSVALSTTNGPLGWLRLADQPRPEALRAVRALKSLGLETVMLTGDNPATAQSIASGLGIDDVRASLLPEDKARVVADLDASNGPAGMVGDGVNDAPALAAARVSIAMGGLASASAIETADIVLLSSDLDGLPWLVRHSRRALRIIKTNIALAVGAKAVFLALAVVGWANLWLAIAADVGVSLLVVANALRLLGTTSVGRQS